jgi:hypothetical protein
MHMATGGVGWCHRVFSATPHYKQASDEQLLALVVAVTMPSFWGHGVDMLPSDVMVVEFADRARLISVLKETMNVVARIESSPSPSPSPAGSSAVPPRHFRIEASVGGSHDYEATRISLIIPQDATSVFGDFAVDVVRCMDATRTLSEKNVRDAHASPAASGPARCAHCAVEVAKIRACSLCRHVVYCGAECQKAHWKAGHRASCSRAALPIKTSLLDGRDPEALRSLFESLVSFRTAASPPPEKKRRPPNASGAYPNASGGDRVDAEET